MLQKEKKIGTDWNQGDGELNPSRRRERTAPGEAKLLVLEPSRRRAAGERTPHH